MSSRDLEPVGVNASWPASTSNRNVPALSGMMEPIGYGNPSAGATELNIAALWQIVWEWRWLILSAIAVGFGLAVVVTLLTTPLYRSVATIEINAPQVRVMDSQSNEDRSANDF